MAKKQKKFYVVWQGRKPGVYESWDMCKKQVDGFTGAKYKSFPTREAADQAFAGSSRQYIGKVNYKRTGSMPGSHGIGKPKLDSISVDAACEGPPGRLEYRGVHTKTGKILFERGPFEEGTNNIGEFLAIVHAAAILKEKESLQPIYTDSRTAMSWVRKKYANTKLKQTSKNLPLFELVARAERWLEENEVENEILKWETKAWGEIPADYGRK